MWPWKSSIAICSGKHSTSTACSHGLDSQRLFKVQEFASFVFTPWTNIPKPAIIVMRIVDEGPDKHPRFMKTVSVAIHNFKIMNFDARFVCTNAPKHSAFNPVERRMALLSRELAGLAHSPTWSLWNSPGWARKSHWYWTWEMQLQTCWWNIGSSLEWHGGWPTSCYRRVYNQSKLNTAEMTTYDEVWFKDHVRTSHAVLLTNCQVW